MLIRSQNKKTIFDMTGCTLFVTEENRILGYGNNCSKDDSLTLLGEYPTEKRDIEVLDKIEEYFVSLNNEYRFGYVKNGVFQMPEV